MKIVILFLIPLYFIYNEARPSFDEFTLGFEYYSMNDGELNNMLPYMKCKFIK